MGMANLYKDPYPEHRECPFCARKHLGIEEPSSSRERGKHLWTSAYIYCHYSDCGAHSPQKDTIEEAWAAWDGRQLNGKSVKYE
jgi:Restriction alleviation protein Lar